MKKLAARQVHLDFHTSQWIPDVGRKFDKQQFQAALKEGNIGAITIFAKCHHGYCYYPTQIGTQHPTMDPDFDLTGAIMDAAHEIGVDVPVYITAGWSALDEQQHPEWVMRRKDGSLSMTNVDLLASPSDPRPWISWKNLCLNGPYAQHIYDLTQEIVDRYDRLDGLFYDICSLEKACYCPHCLQQMRQLGYDPENDAQAHAYHVRMHLQFMETTNAILHKKFPEATIFFNGCAEIYEPEYHSVQSYLEMEDLPTTSGGYNKMPPRASYMRRYGKEILGQTGKFHTVWGEFGGYKNPQALKYEALTMAMNGAKCCIGDQMPPSGQMDMETYRSIGIAFRALEEIEPYAYPALPTADVGVYLSGNPESDQGLHTVLLESQIDFEVVVPGDDLSAYRLLILPDYVDLPESEALRLQQFANQGGAIVFGYRSALRNGSFLLDAGMQFRSEPVYAQDYLFPRQIQLPFGNAPFLCYNGSMQITATDGDILCDTYEPYFDRTYAHYCSHMNTPSRDYPSGSPAMVQKGNLIYYAHPLCQMYYKDGAEVFKQLLRSAIYRIYRPRYRVDIPSAGRTRLTYQPEEDRYIFHISYASPIQRGAVSVIEDIVPLTQIPVSIRLEQKVTSVSLVPQCQEIPFSWENGEVKFVIPRVECYQGIQIRTCE